VRAHVPDGFAVGGRRAVRGLATGDAEIVTTSGTSDERLSIVWHQAWWDRSEAAAARLNAVLAPLWDGPRREAVLTTPLCGVSACHVVTSTMEQRTEGSLLFLNQHTDPTTWDPSAITRIAAELEQFAPDVLEADPAYAALLCRRALHAGRALFQPRCIVLTYEYPSLLHLRWIARAFPGVPVVSSYGSTETGHVFTQCECGLFHQNTATCRVDIQRMRPGRGDPSTVRLLVSTMGNPWFTLLRFDVGDLARLSDQPCPCGRTDGLTVATIEGRLRDATLDAEGRLVTVGALDRALGSMAGLLAYQVVQAAPRTLSVRYEADPEGHDDTARALTAALAGLYGPGMQVVLRRESAIAPELSGKFRLARCGGLPPAEELFA
jgi:phenylacetate-CoA ligase